MRHSLDAWTWGVSRSDRPILIGPWQSEVGFEVLYWLPYLEAWREQVIDAQFTRQVRRRRWRFETLTPENLATVRAELQAALAARLVAVTRGGAGVWYDVGQSVELYDYAPLEDLRVAVLARATETGSIKQLGVSPWERALLDLIQTRHGWRRAHVLSPSQMYQSLTPWWEDRMSLRDALGRLRFRDRLPVPAVPLSVTLPAEYVVVRWYERATWRFTEDLCDWMRALVTEMAKRIPVVVLSSLAWHDDHVDLRLEGPNITTLSDPWPLRENLAAQSAIIARALGYVGTYGGMSQLAVRLRRPTLAFYATLKGTAPAHKALTEWLSTQTETPCWMGRPQDFGALSELAGRPWPFPPPSKVGSSS